jgi:biotin carboxylase
MLLALKELSVRGDVRTPVEVLIHILATRDFRNSLVMSPRSTPGPAGLFLSSHAA